MKTVLYCFILQYNKLKLEIKCITFSSNLLRSNLFVYFSSFTNKNVRASIKLALVRSFRCMHYKGLWWLSFLWMCIITISMDICDLYWKGKKSFIIWMHNFWLSPQVEAVPHLAITLSGMSPSEEWIVLKNNIMDGCHGGSKVNSLASHFKHVSKRVDSVSICDVFSITEVSI